jgi:hypothetical protein
MTLTKARELVAEFFVIELPEQADDLLCAALRVEHIESVSWRDRGWPEMDQWWTEQRIRDCLASTRALFARSFGVKTDG